MKLAALLLAALCLLSVNAEAQIIKALSYNTTNGTVLAGTNRIQFTNRISVPAGGGTNDVMLRLGTNNTGFYVLTNLGTPVALVHNDALAFAASTASFVLYKPLSFVAATNADTTRTNLGLGLPALTNTSNTTTMRALAGSTNTNEPFSGIIQVQELGGFDDLIQITISNGIIVKVEL
jgi:hypothetical protein